MKILREKVEYFEFNKEIRPDIPIDDLELLDPSAFEKLIKKQSMIGYKLI
jgi:hypothetical protein